MAAMPSPVDLRIWLLSKVLGWPGRKVAEEVGVSQSTVVRTVERLSNDPPTDEEMQDFVTVASATPPKGMPVIRARAHQGKSPLMLAVTGAVIIIALAVAVVLVALAVAILSHY